MRKCFECGKELADDNQICSNCGAPERRPAAANQPDKPLKVTVVDFDMSFGQMVVFMLKWAFACIPALLIFLFLMGVLAGMLGIVFPRSFL